MTLLNIGAINHQNPPVRLADIRCQDKIYPLWSMGNSSAQCWVPCEFSWRKLQLLTVLLLLCSERFECGSFKSFWHLDYSFSRWDWKTCTKFIFNKELSVFFDRLSLFLSCLYILLWSFLFSILATIFHPLLSFWHCFIQFQQVPLHPSH